MNVLDITSPPNVSAFVPNQDKIWPALVKLTRQAGDKLLSSSTVEDGAAW